MNADFNNMQVGDYVMIASSVEVEDNAKLYTRGEEAWIFITDFSGAQGIQGEQGPQGEQGIQGIQGIQGPTGPTGNGISSIAKTSTSGLVDTYTITFTNGNTTTFNVTNGNGITSITKTATVGSVDTYTITFTNGTTTTFEVTNGEVTQAQLDEVIEQYNRLLNQIPSASPTPSDTLYINDSADLPLKKFVLEGKIEQATAILPSEYTQVDYITQSWNGGNFPYIDTGYKANNNTKVSADVTVTTVEGAGRFVFGSKDSNETPNRFQGLVWTDNKVAGGYGSGSIYQSNTVQAIDTRFNITLDKNLLYHNGTLLKTFTTETFACNQNLYLFTANTIGSPDTQIMNGNLYSCKIWDNETLVRDYIPCKRNSDSKVGLYDLVNSQFYTSANAYNFTAGENTVLPNPYYPQEIYNVEGKNIANPLLESGTINADTGAEVVQATAVRSGYIDISDSDVWTISRKTNTPNIKPRYYDKNYNYVGYEPAIGGVSLKTITRPQNAKYIRMTLDTTNLNYFTDNEVQLEKGSVATDYVPYGCIGIKKVNKNLFDKSKAVLGYISDISGAYMSTNDNYASNYINIKNANYIVITSSQGDSRWGAFYDKNYQFISGITGYSSYKEVPTNAVYCRLTIRPNSLDTFQVEEGQVATSYVEHAEKTYYFPFEGQKLMQDGTIDGKVNNTWAEIEFDGSEDENWTHENLSGYGNIDSFYINIPNAVGNRNQKIYNSIGMYSYDLDATGKCYISTGKNLNFVYDGITTVSAFKTRLAELKQAGTPMIVQYKLATPTSTDFTPEQQAVYNEIIKDGTYNPTTYYSTNALLNPNIDLTYYRDLPAIINNLENE